MHIGIIVHSLTGNTLTVAQKIRDKLTAAGHEAEIEQIAVAGGEDPQKREFELSSPPDVLPYEALVFGAPVRAFSVSPVIAVYLKQMAYLDGRKVALYVTKGLRSNWTGGNKAIASMRALCEKKGGVVASTGIVSQKSKDYAADVDRLAEQISALF